MASPIFQSFCCADGSFVLYGNSSEGVSLSADDVAFLCYNIICVVSSTAGVSGCLYQLVKRTPRCLGCRSTADNALLLLVQNNIIACLAAADLLAALGILVRSSLWLAGYVPDGNSGHCFANLLCVILSGWIQCCFTCTYLWTLIFAVNMYYMSRDPDVPQSWMWAYHAVSWPLPVILCFISAIPLYWPSLDGCIERQTFLIPVYVSTYVPLLAVMIACPVIYAAATRLVVKKSFASGDQTLNIYDRRVLCSVREMFFAFVFVFYICWLPNVVHAVLLLLPSLNVHFIFVAVLQLMALLNPVQPVLNCLMYDHVSSVWSRSPTVSCQSNSLSSPSEIPSDNPIATLHPARDTSSSPLLIFGDS